MRWKIILKHPWIINSPSFFPRCRSRSALNFNSFLIPCCLTVCWVSHVDGWSIQPSIHLSYIPFVWIGGQCSTCWGCCWFCCGGVNEGSQPFVRSVNKTWLIMNGSMRREWMCRVDDDSILHGQTHAGWGEKQPCSSVYRQIIITPLSLFISMSPGVASFNRIAVARASEVVCKSPT